LVIGATTAPDGLAHFFAGSAGVVAADASARIIVAESSGDGGISILTPNANWGGVYFGSPANNKAAWLSYNQSSGTFGFEGPAGGRMVFNALLQDVNYAWGSDDEAYMFAIDGGQNKVTIGQQAPHTDMLLTMIDDDWNNENAGTLLAFTQWAMGPITGAERAATTNIHSLSMSVTKQSQWAQNRYITRSDIGWNRYDIGYWASSWAQLVGSNWASTTFSIYDGTTESVIASLGNQGIVFNESALDLDIRFESENEVDAFVLDAGLDALGFGTASLAADTFTFDTDKFFHMGGTSFPGAPSAGDLYYRTDLHMWCEYDGTRWLTTHEYMRSTDYSTAADTGTVRISPLRTDYSIYVTNVEVNLFINGVNDGSNYWSVYLRGAEVDWSALDTFHSYVTSGDSGSTWIVDTGAPNVKNIPANNKSFAINFTKTNSPGNCLYSIGIYYRLIIT